jgi:hypothetical protein
MGRLWRTFMSMDPAERGLVDPDGAIPRMREAAIAYVRDDLFSATINPLDAAQGVLALVLLEHEDRHDGLIAHGCQVLVDHLGEGRFGRPYKGYEWTLVRHPTRIIVGSATATTLFALGALAEARAYLFGDAI